MGLEQNAEYGNVYFEARKAASAWDSRFKTREGAAEVLNIAPYTLGQYERGETKVIPPDRVADMARAYKAPELLTDYCMNVCPVHGFLPLATKAKGIQGIALRVILKFNEQDMCQMKDELVQIAEDGVVTEDEVPKMEQILGKLEGVAETISEMKIATLKAVGGR